MPARRPVLLVTLAHGRSLLLKWLEPEGCGSNLEIEAMTLLSELDVPAVLRAALPRMVCFDEDQRLLVLEGAAGYQTWREAAVRGADERLTHLATVLAALHGLDVRDLQARYGDRRLFLPLEPIRDLTPAEFAQGPGMEYGTYVEAVQAVNDELAELLARWRPLRLSHFDLRDDNVLLAPPGDGALDPVRLVDWELAGFGDPLYDVGAVVGQLVHHALPALPRAAAARFVDTYVACTQPSAPICLDVMRYAGVFLLLRALAMLHATASLGTSGRLAIVLGCRFLSHPSSSAERLLA
jgi:aminoglycoside phosphotransferase (APT) family kinase protein